MTLSALICELGKDTIDVIQEGFDALTLQGCKLYTQNQAEFSAGFIYYLADYDFPVSPPDVNVIILLKDKSSIPKNYLGLKNVSILALKPNASAEFVFNRIQDILTEEPLILKSTRQLMEALFSDLGLQYLVDIAFEITGHPIYVSDTSYQYLAISHKGNIEKLDSPVLQEENKLGFIVDEGVRLIKKTRLDESIRKNERPYYFDNVVLGGGTLIDLLKIHNVEIGHIMMYEAGKAFTRFDRVLLSRLAGMVALELQKNNFYKHNRGEMYSYFLGDLLKNGVANYSSVNKRLQVLGFALKEQLYIMAIDSESERMKNETHLNVIAEQLPRFLVSSMYVVYHDKLILLISRTDAGITEYEYEQLGKYLEENSLVAGVSNCFDNIQDIRQYYRQALKAAEFGDKVFKKPAIYHYHDISMFYMFSICESQESLMNFFNPKLLILLNYDKEHNAELTKTLHQYLKQSQNSLKTASSLNIHKNTLLYRIEKIKKIIGSSLDDGEELMQLQISFHILRYQQRI